MNPEVGGEGGGEEKEKEGEEGNPGWWVVTKSSKLGKEKEKERARRKKLGKSDNGSFLTGFIKRP